MSLMNPLTHAFGLDIGDRTFKIVQVAKRRHPTAPYRITAWGSVDVPEGVLERGEIRDLDKATECLTSLLGKIHGRLKGRAVVGCLPEARSFVKVIELEDVRGAEAIGRAVLKEIEQNIPLPIDEIYYDWHLVEHHAHPAAPKPTDAEIREGDVAQGNSTEKERELKAAEGGATKAAGTGEGRPPGTETEPKIPMKDGEAPEKETQPPPEADRLASRTRIMLAAAPKKLVDNYVTMMEMAGLAPIALEIEATAIARAIVPFDDSLDEPLGILDIGATRSSLIVCDEEAMQMSISVPLSGNELTEIISRELKISLTDADLVKIECGLDAHRCEDKMWSILLPLIDDMTNKIRNALRFYHIGFPSGKKVERLYLCGGGAHFRDIDNVLSRKLTIKARRGDALVNVSKVPKSFPQDLSLAYTTAIGLALRASDENERFHHSFRV